MTTTTSNAGRQAIQHSLYGRQIGMGATNANLPQGAQPLVVRGESSSVNFSAAPGAANISLVTMQLADNEGSAVKGVQEIEWWLSDAATGIGLTGTTASGAVAAGTAGTDLVALVSKKMTKSLTDANGIFIASITDTGKTGFFIAVRLGRHLGPRVSAALVAGNYG